MKHRCGLDCFIVVDGELVSVCKHCKHGKETRLALAMKNPGKKKYPPLTAAQKECAAEFIPEEVEYFKRGGRGSYKQSVAVGLSRARRQC